MTAGGRREALARRLRLYVLTDEGLSRGRPTDQVVAEAIAGGATAIQLRGKDWGGRRLVEVGHRLRALTREAGVLFFVNDRLDVALAVGADGVHLGQDDLPLAEARRIAGPDFLIGISVEDEAQALAAEAGGADYLGAGTVYPTGSKADAGEPIGLDGLARIARRVRIPVVAIGGIHAGNAPDVMRAGAAGVAVISAVVAAPDVRAAARALRGAVDSARPTAPGGPDPRGA